MKTRRLLPFACGSLLLTGLWLAMPDTRSRAAVSAVDPGANTASAFAGNTAQTGAAAAPTEALISDQYSWPHESGWAKLAPLPEVTYAVVPLRALGWPADAYPVELDNYGGVLGDWGWDNDWARATIYWWPEIGFGTPYIVPVLSYSYDEIWDLQDSFYYWRPEAYNWGHFYDYATYGLAWPWDNYPWPGWAWGWGYALNPTLWGDTAQTPTRRMSSDGLVAGWVVEWDGAGYASGTMPAIWSSWWADGSDPWSGTGLLPFRTSGYPFNVATAMGVNTWGDTPAWRTGTAWSQIVQNYPAGQQAVRSEGGLIKDSGAVTMLGGSLQFQTSSQSAVTVPTGQSFVPQFINDYGMTAGLRYVISTAAQAGAVNWYPLYGAGRVTGEPVVYLYNGQIRSLDLDPADRHELYGLTSGWMDYGTGTLQSPPVAWGVSWHSATEDYWQVTPRWWWSHPGGGTEGEWVTKDIQVYAPWDGGQDYPLDQSWLWGLRRISNRLEMILDYWDWWLEEGGGWAQMPVPGVVRNGHLYELNQQLAGVTYDGDGNWYPGYWWVRYVQDLNDSGVILATVAPAWDEYGDLLNLYHYDADGYLIEADWARAGASEALAEPAFLVPMERAPDVLRVNNNFDEQKIDPVTGYALPDNADTSLVAARGPMAGKIVTKDLHQGFFGLRPSPFMPNFFDGATVTIAKLPNVDPETGLVETGAIRLYATKTLGQGGEQVWEIPMSDPATGVANDLVSVLYGNNPSIPSGPDVEYWMEGISPGPITIEFQYTKGSLTFTHQQHFLVCTQQSKAQWQEEIRQQILLQTSVTAGGAVDFAHYSKTPMPSPFFTKKAYIQNVYGYYQWLFFQRSDSFLWAGLAKMAGGPVYAGMNDAEYGRTVVPSWAPGWTLSTANGICDFFQNTLIKGNYDIFDDLAWQFYAYQASGIWALRYIATDPRRLAPSILRDFSIGPWNEIWQGEYGGAPIPIANGNNLLTQREQRYIVQGAWDDFHAVAIPIPLLPVWQSLLNALAPSPLRPLGHDFNAVVPPSTAFPSPDITQFPDRWEWIQPAVAAHVGTGIWDTWLGIGPGSPNGRRGYAAVGLKSRATNYSRFWAWSWTSYPVIW